MPRNYITDIEKKKQGIVVALSLPEDHEKGIRDKVFEELSLNELKADDGLGKLIVLLEFQQTRKLTVFNRRHRRCIMMSLTHSD